MTLNGANGKTKLGITTRHNESCVVSPHKLAVGYFKLAGCDRVVPLCAEQAKKHRAKSEFEVTQELQREELERIKALETHEARED